MFAVKQYKVTEQSRLLLPHAVGATAPVRLFVVKPVGHGTHALCFFIPAL